MKQAPEILQKRGCESFALGTVPLALVPCKNADLDVCFCGLGAKQVADGRERETDRQTESHGRGDKKTRENIPRSRSPVT